MISLGTIPSKGLGLDARQHVGIDTPLTVRERWGVARLLLRTQWLRFHRPSSLATTDDFHVYWVMQNLLCLTGSKPYRSV